MRRLRRPTWESESNRSSFHLVTPLYSPLKLRGDEGGLKKEWERASGILDFPTISMII
jgi:hypothetical protein